MENSDTIQRIRQVLSRIGVLDTETIDNNEDLNEWITDSIMFISLIVELEDEFEIQIPDKYLNKEFISSLSSLSESIVQLLNSGKMDDDNEAIEIKKEIQGLYLEKESLKEKMKNVSTDDEKREIDLEIRDIDCIVEDLKCIIQDYT